MIEAVIFEWGATLTPRHTVEPHGAWLAAVSDTELATRLHAAEEAMWIRSRDEHRSVLSNTIWPRTEHERIFARDEVCFGGWTQR